MSLKYDQSFESHNILLERFASIKLVSRLKEGIGHDIVADQDLIKYGKFDLGRVEKRSWTENDNKAFAMETPNLGYAAI